MNINVDGVDRPMTDDELAALDAARAQWSGDVTSGAITGDDETE